MFHKLRQSNPTSGVHMEMGLVSDIFLINLVGPYTLRSKPIFKINIQIRKRMKESKQIAPLLLLAFSKATKRIQIETDSKSPQYDYPHVLQLQASDEDEIPRQHDI